MSKRITITLTDDTYAELSEISRLLGFSKSAIASVSLSEPLHRLIIALLDAVIVEPALFDEYESKRASGTSVEVLQQLIDDIFAKKRGQK